MHKIVGIARKWEGVLGRAENLEEIQEKRRSVVVIGPGRFFLTQIGSGQPSMVWAWIWKIFPKNINFFIFFPSGQKISSGSGQKVPGSTSYLLRVKSKLGLGQGQSLVSVGKCRKLQGSAGERDEGVGIAINLPHDPMKLFLTLKEKNTKIWDFGGEIFQTQRWLTQLDLGQKLLT